MAAQTKRPARSIVPVVTALEDEVWQLRDRVRVLEQRNHELERAIGHRKPGEPPPEGDLASRVFSRLTEVRPAHAGNAALRVVGLDYLRVILKGESG